MSLILQSAIEKLFQAQGISPSDLRRASQAISEKYRRQTTQSAKSCHAFALCGVEEYLAYMAVRQPATYAAALYVFNQLKSQYGDLADIETVLDAGSGPGTALWALRELIPWRQAQALELHKPWIDISRRLWGYHPTPCNVDWIQQDLQKTLLKEKSFDLVIACYSLNELPDAKLENVLERLWSATGKIFVWIEPGTLECFEKQLAFRKRILKDPSARILAPCTGQGLCPYSQMDTFPETGPGWCHFQVRLERSRYHREIKQATLGFEDEKFSYLIIAKNSKHTPSGYRIMQDPKVRSGHVRLVLCDSHTMHESIVTKAKREVFQRSKHAQWGQVWHEEDDTPLSQSSELEE